MATVIQDLVTLPDGSVLAPVYNTNYAAPSAQPVLIKPFQPPTVSVTDSYGNQVTYGNTYLETNETWEDYYVTFPYGPQGLKYDNYAGKSAQVARPKKKALLVYENPELRTVSFSAIIADPLTGGLNPVPVQDILDKIEFIASQGIPCKFVYGVEALPYSVVITKYTYEVLQRDINGAATQVTVDIQFTEKVLLDLNLTQLAAVVASPEPSTIVPEVPESSEDEIVRDVTANVDIGVGDRYDEVTGGTS